MRISLRFGLCITGLIAGYLFSVVQHHLHSLHTEAALQRTASLTFPGARLTQNLLAEFKQQDQAFENAVIFGDAEAIAKARDHAQTITQTAARISALPEMEPGRLAEIFRLTEDLKAYMDTAIPVYAGMASNHLMTSPRSDEVVRLAETKDGLLARMRALSEAFANDLRAMIDSTIDTTVNQRAASTTSFIVIVCGTLIIIGVVLTRWVHRLKMVMAASEELAAGDYSTPVVSSGSDEINQLAVTFNRMRTAVQRRDQELRTFNERLEDLIRERTGQLESRTFAYQEQLHQTQKANARIALLDTAITQVPDAIGIANAEDRELEYANLSLQRLLIDEDQDAAATENTLAHFIRTAPIDRPDLKELLLKRLDGNHHLEAHSTPIIEADGTRANIILFIRDVTEAKIRESQISQSQRLESIGQLAAGVAHEINTPIQFIGDNLRFLQESFRDLSPLIELQDELCTRTPPNDPELAERLDQARQQADYGFRKEEIPGAIEQSLEGIDRVAIIVRSLKEFAHPESDTFAATDLRHAIESTLNVSRNEYKYVAELSTDFDDTLPPVSCLAGKINQVVLNMVVNASHAIEAKGSAERGRITVSTRRDGEWAEIRIGDSGCGMTEAVKQRVFEPFFTTKEVGKGTGQGLYLAHDIIVNKHRGTIDIDSTPGEGTTFILRIPIEQDVGADSRIL